MTDAEYRSMPAASDAEIRGDPPPYGRVYAHAISSRELYMGFACLLGICIADGPTPASHLQCGRRWLDVCTLMIGCSEYRFEST